MHEVITRAIKSIEYLSENEKYKTSIHQHTLNNIHDLFIKLNSIENEWIELFCRQLDRLMSNNKKLQQGFWINLYDDLIYVLKGPNGEASMGNNWNNFLKKIANEKKRMQREIELQHKVGKRKTLKQIINENPKFINEYLQDCIRLYSKVQINGLIENIHDFLLNNCQLNELSIIKKSSIEEHLQCIDIRLDCSNRFLADIDDNFATFIGSCRADNHDLSNFLPSIERELFGFGESKIIEELLEYDRWIVILGDPGSGKSTLLRWIMYIFAEAAYHNYEQVNLSRNRYVPTRIPILIRLNEFSTWLYQHETKTLKDYIDNLSDEKENIFEKFIDHGHALILLDGLDKIDDVRRRREIVGLIKTFTNEYICTPDFCSAFDDITHRSILTDGKTVYYETGPPKTTGGNQLILISRTIGYQFHPLLGSYIHHYLLVLMEHKESKIFIKKWMIQVEKSISKILCDEGIELNQEKMKYLSNRRSNIIEYMFKKRSKCFISNPLLLCFICKIIFQLNKNFYPKSRIEIYDYIVQSALNSWPHQELNISKNVVIKFLIHLSTYLHANSSSGLIDAFDMKRFCQMILKQQENLSINRQKLSEYTDKTIRILQLNMNIIIELDFEVFTFQHLSFQDYFVTQYFLEDSSIENIVKRILTFTIKPRFRKSLLLTLGWISWKWSFKDYNQFCNLLISHDKSYTIPLGILLFFEGFNDLKRLPAKSVIFNALNNLFNCSINIIVEKYFLWNFLKLSKDLIKEWIELHVKDEKNLGKFCQCLLMACQLKISQFQNKFKSILPKIYQQLKIFCNQNPTNEFIIDQTFRRIMLIQNPHEYIFHNELSSYLLSENISISTIHPLILSVIFLVCGGMNLILENQYLKINFSSKQMYRQSSIIPSIVEYLMNSEEPHLIKMKSLINYYENILEKTSKTDTSNEIIDIFIALICLKGLSIEMIYEKYHEYSALFFAAIRLKQNWFHLKQTWLSEKFPALQVDYSSILSDIYKILNIFCPKSLASEKQRLRLSLSCASALNKLDIDCSSISFAPKYFLPIRNNKNLTNEKNSIEITEQISPKLFTFIPQHLRNLYYCMINESINEMNLILRVIFLLQSLIHLEHIDTNDSNYYLSLSRFRSQFHNYMIENYLVVLLLENNSKKQNEQYRQYIQRFFEQMCIDEPIDLKKLIEIERQRILDANDRKDLQFLITSVVLARLFQAQYRSQATKCLNISIEESNEVYTIVTNINNPILQIFAFSVLLDMKDPLIFEIERREDLRLKMINLLQNLLPNLSLLVGTLLFIRCYSIYEYQPLAFHQMTEIIIEKFSNDKHNQEPVFIALKQLNNSDLSNSLFKFIKQNSKLSEVFHLNSTIFFKYFIKKTSFDSSNTVLLSLMYITELAFDMETLQIDRISNRKELDQLWNDFSSNEKIMSSKVAKWITNYLNLPNKKNLSKIIENISCCLIIESKALSEIEKWLEYRMDKSLKYFAYYAALQLIIEGSNSSNLFDIIKKNLNCNQKYNFISLLKRLIESDRVNLCILRQILILLHENVEYFRQISVSIHRKEVLELIFDCELERISSNVSQSFAISTVPFILIVNECSYDLRVFLLEYLKKFLENPTEIRNTFKEEYIAVLCKWIIENSIWNDKKEDFSFELYKYILSLLHNHYFLQIQRAIINGFSSVLTNYTMYEEHLFLQGYGISHLEQIIFLFDEYSFDVLNICLLAFGNYLYLTQKSNKNQKISNELNQSLKNIFNSSLPDVIIIRAAFCLIIAQKSLPTFEVIINLFDEKWILTPEKKYNILLEKTLYHWDWDESYANKYEIEEEIVIHIENYSSELLDIFAKNLHDYLYDKSNHNYLSNPTVNYVKIAYQAIEKNFLLFQKLIQKNIFSERIPKEEVYQYLYHKKDKSDIEVLINLYIMCGILTNELIDIWEWITNVYNDQILIQFIFIKQIDNENVIEKLFQFLYSMVNNRKFQIFENLLCLLHILAQDHLVSSSELCDQVSIIMNDLSDEFHSIDWIDQKSIFGTLLEFTSIKTINSSNKQMKLFTENDIHEEFMKTMENLGRKPAFFLRTNTSVSNSTQLSMNDQTDNNLE